MRLRRKEHRSAGMDNIRSLVQESEKRITAVKSGQSYAKHVEKFQVLCLNFHYFSVMTIFYVDCHFKLILPEIVFLTHDSSFF